MKADLARENGLLKIRIDGKIYEPLAFRTFRPEQRNVHDFYKAGIRLMNVLCTGMDCTLDVPYAPFGEIWNGIGNYDFSVLDRQMELFIGNAPDAYINLMLQLDTRDWYLSENRECSNSYRNLVEMAGYGKWREDVRRYLEDVISYAENTYGERIYAYSLVCGSSNEWYTNPPGFGGAESQIRHHPIKERCYREFTGSPESRLPNPATLFHSSHGAFRDPDRDAKAIDYWRFHHGVIGDAILYFSAAVKEVTDRAKLVGLFYGYLNTLGRQRLLHEGHLGYERVWASPDIDMIYSPAKYGEPRTFTGASGYLTTVDSIGVHGKLTFQELDHRTHIAPTHLENGREVPGIHDRPKNDFETRMILRREYALVATKRTAVWWFDFFGGYYYSRELMDDISLFVRTQERLSSVPIEGVSQIAVFGDVGSMFYASEYAGLSDDLLVEPSIRLARLGAPFDIYTLSDIESDSIPHDRYELYVFLNAFRLSDEIRTFIKRRLQTQEKTILWLYAPDYISEKGFSTDSLSDLVGMRVAEYDGVKSDVRLVEQDSHDIKWNPLEFAYSQPVLPLFEITDNEATVLARYAQSGKAAAALKKTDAATNVYSAVGNLPVEFYREIARLAGVHIFHEGANPVYVANRLLGVQLQQGGSLRITLPDGAATTFEDLYDGGTVKSEGGVLELNLEAGTAKLFLSVDGNLL